MMAFQRNFITCVLDQSNKPLREFGENGQRVAHLESGQEYKLRVKNKSEKRAYVRVNIDGTDVLTGNRSFVMKPYEELDLERFVDDLNTGKRFKFLSIEEGIKTNEIQDPSNPLNGRIRVSIWPELAVPKINVPPWYGPFGINPTYSNSSSSFSSSVRSCTNNTLTASAMPLSTNAGATAEGSASNQQFGSSYEFFLTENPFDIDIWLKVAGRKQEKAWEFRATSTGALVFYKHLLLEQNSASIENGSMVLRIPIGAVNLSA